VKTCRTTDIGRGPSSSQWLCKIAQRSEFFEDACVRLLLKLRAMPAQPASRDQLLLRIGAAKKEAGRAFGFIKAQAR